MNDSKKRFPAVTDEYVKRVLKTGPRNITLSGAEKYTQNVKSHVSSPGEYGVNEMRNWSIENEK